ncbi:MAG: hypothetical protein KGZ51_00790 [Erysipelothrix sp.]|jgi:hypothetical protein|nr:hypothetical protein [Erysipelothrix sp.]
MSLLKKLHFKDINPFIVINLPKQLQETLDEMTGFFPRSDVIIPSCKFVLCFVLNQDDLKKLIPTLIPYLDEDAMFWVAYPKRTSKQFKTDLTRDNGWELLGKYGYEQVSLVSLNDDFSIFRIRHVKYIKTMIRSDSMKLTKSKNNDV